ncbi:hypothetical protein [Devriesea agamarum]|uniref:hypothetical protein n=1 Tax=Devriesea agamarum TaxID=472569 RepID=UPI00071C577C|nr:hypothetical protein [Devriesea agamarum]
MSPRELHHPWRHLRDHWPHVRVEYGELPAGRLAETDGIALIRLRSRLVQAERRVAICHETIHLERGHRNPCSAAEERSVEEETARRLISLDDLVWALRWTRDLQELADELWVMPATVATRLDRLNADERKAVSKVCSDLELAA